MKNKIFILLFLGIFLIGIVSSANYYVTDPNNCPNSYQSQTCSGSNKVCGYLGGVTFCYDNSLLTAPIGSTTSSTSYSCSDSSCSTGGYITDCYSYTGSSPFCNNGGNYICASSSTCTNTNHVYTTCNGESFTSASCSSTCLPNYFSCNEKVGGICEITAGASCGSGTGTIANNQCYSASVGNCTSSTKLDCNNDDGDENLVTCNGADGCEITNGGSCTAGSLSGTYNGCTCTVSKSFFQTGTQATYLTSISQAFLWGIDYFTGTLINLSWSTGGGFLVNASGVYFNNTLLSSGVGGSGNITGIGTLNYIPMWNSTTSLNNSAIYQNGSNIGIGTTNPFQALHVNGNILANGTIKSDGLNLTANSNITFNGNGNQIWSNTTCLQLKGSTVTMFVC